MAYQLWIADALRAAQLPHGLSFEPGWETRGSVNFAPEVVLDHHTGSLRDITAMLRDGRPGLSGPLSQIELRRSGEVRVIAAGRANHAGAGSWRGVTGNTRALGIEATSDGKSWTPMQLEVYPIVNAALLRGIHRDALWLCGHKEWTSRKWDPGAIDMGQMRNKTRDILARQQPAPTAPTLEDGMICFAFWHKGAVYFSNGLVRSPWGMPPGAIDVMHDTERVQWLPGGVHDEHPMIQLPAAAIR
jgi:hypothetical protein